MRSTLVMAALVGLILSSCASAGLASVTPDASSTHRVDETGSPLPTATPATPEPTASPHPTETPASGAPTLATVLVNDIAVRTGPATSAPRLDDHGRAIRVDAGDHVLALGAPVRADGYVWQTVGLEEDPIYYALPQTVGWIAIGTDDESWITRNTDLCPSEVSVSTLMKLPAIARVGCFGSERLQFEARQTALRADAGLGGLCQDAPNVPNWLTCDNINYNWVNLDGGTEWQLLLHFDPERGIPETGLAPVGTTGPRYEIIGHFADPAADYCRVADNPSELDALSAWLTCAGRFVVTSLKRS